MEDVKMVPLPEIGKNSMTQEGVVMETKNMEMMQQGMAAGRIARAGMMGSEGIGASTIAMVDPVFGPDAGKLEMDNIGQN